MLTVQSDSAPWSRRLIKTIALIAMITLIVLVLFQKKPVGNRSELVQAEEKLTNTKWQTCQKRLTNVASQWKSAPLPIASDAKFVEADDAEYPLTVNRIKSWRPDVDWTNTDHKSILHRKDTLIFVYNDNTVVIASVDPCVITRVYSPRQDGSLQTQISSQIQSKETAVIADKGGSSCKWEEQSCSVATDCCSTAKNWNDAEQICCPERGNKCVWELDALAYLPSRWCSEQRIPKFHGWTAIGCYDDCVNGHRTLREHQDFHDSMTPAKCLSFCSQYGTRYFGVEFGRECFCGNTLHVDESIRKKGCRSRCAGNNEMLCGGGCKIQIWRRN